jgi:predicted nucleic acid-binding Zn finger protein
MCDCPNFLFRLIKVGGECKHISAVKEFRNSEGEDKFSDIISEAEDWTDIISLMEKYGDDKVQSLIDRGELIEQKGKVKQVK